MGWEWIVERNSKSEEKEDRKKTQKKKRVLEIKIPFAVFYFLAGILCALLFW